MELLLFGFMIVLLLIIFVYVLLYDQQPIGSWQRGGGLQYGAKQHTIPPRKIVLRLENLTVFRGQDCVLDNITLIIHEGERVAIIGESGGGKSTLINVVRGDLIPTQGSVILEGKKLRYNNSTALKEHYLKVPVIDQSTSSLVSFHSIHKSIVKQLLVKGITREQANDEAYKYLRKMKIVHKADSLPEHLSGGERQRAVTAKSLAMGDTVKLLLADEPTSALDPGLAREIVHSLAETKFAIIFVTHQIELVMNEVDRILLLQNGKLVDVTIIKERCPQYFMGILEECGGNSYYPVLAKTATQLQKQKAQELKEQENEHMGTVCADVCHSSLSKNQLRENAALSHNPSLTSTFNMRRNK